MITTRSARPAHRSLKALATAGAAAVAVGLVPAAAGAQASAAPQAAGVATAKAAAAAKSYTYLQYKKNKKDPSNSRLSLIHVQQISPDKTRSYVLDSWRAGSGLGTAKNKVGRNACQSNVGWLPSGDYKIEYFKNNFVGTINGIVWKLQDKRCKANGKKGTKRDALFIHSEMKSNGKQGSSEPTRWDGNGDYKSAGCVKLKPSDIRELKGYRSNFPKPTRLYVS
ncbi:L,D-transpeptidase family protein [Streptomyces sp. NPDC051310]|uniref:L,D-transpeptidase family protein n=1 Tax=Streptomyces sp. NPDC051310 TaxID=3365649 RepID=UPI0037895B39